VLGLGVKILREKLLVYFHMDQTLSFSVEIFLSTVL
jgi:hypothetical protein